MEVLLDSSFIISCIRRKIDFVEELENLGFKVLVPKEVLQELKDLKKTERVSREDRNAVDIAFEMLNIKNVKKTRVGGKNVDEGLIEKGKKGFFIASLDNGIKHKIENRVIINNAQNSIMIDRE